MARPTKPRPHPRPAAPDFALSKSAIFEPSIELPEEAWREIEAAIGLNETSPGLRCRVAAYVSLYYYEWSDGGTVRPRHMKEALSKIGCFATSLADYVDYEGCDEALDNPRTWARVYAVDSLLSPKERKAFVATLREISNNAVGTIGGLPKDKGGPSADGTFVGFVCALATLYHDSTGQMPGVSQPAGGGQYTGPFFRFVRAVSMHLVPAPQRKGTNLALGKALQRALDTWRTKLGIPPPRRRSRMDVTSRRQT
jgi:hypothetical protein